MSVSYDVEGFIEVVIETWEKTFQEYRILSQKFDEVERIFHEIKKDILYCSISIEERKIQIRHYLEIFLEVITSFEEFEITINNFPKLDKHSYTFINENSMLAMKRHLTRLLNAPEYIEVVEYFQGCSADKDLKYCEYLLNELEKVLHELDTNWKIVIEKMQVIWKGRPED